MDRFDPGSTHIQPELSLRYNCCFLWVDVSKKVLKEYLSVLVDDMLDSGMFEELTEFFDSDELLRNDDRVGLRKAIGERSLKKRGLEALKKEGERSLWQWEEWVRDGK